MLGGVSGGVRCSLVTDHRSEPPPWWEPRPGTQPPQDTSDNPVFSSAGAALRARAVHQSLADPGSPPEESPRTSPHARGVAFPATPTSDCSFAHSQAGPRSATLPAGNGSPRQLSVKAHAFVPGTVVAPMAEVDLNEYIKQSVPVRSSPQVQSSGTLPPVENWTPSDEEDAEKQWREQIRRQMEVVGSAAVHSVHGTSGRGSELKHEVETASEEVRRDFPMIQQRPGLKDSPPVVPRVQVVSALSFVHALSCSRAGSASRSTGQWRLDSPILALGATSRAAAGRARSSQASALGKRIFLSRAGFSTLGCFVEIHRGEVRVF
ncbi:hypothetical protein C8T65DRAFT_13172 [Cerioporus squamosus]|nr:hypothetical protein C8T65DRAFT_13172 [Cerioporus squamosus]